MYKIIYHRLIFEKDFKKIPRTDQKRIFRLIHKKLTISPETFGKPLTGDLKGYYRLRCDPYRVVYKIEKQKITVFIVQVGLRKDFLVYFEAAKRLGL